LTERIVTFKAQNKMNKNTKVNSRGMLNVKGIDIENDEGNGVELRRSDYRKSKKEGGCKC